MFQLRRILLSGLVALLMVGMVTASEVYTPLDETEVVIPIGGHIGSWVDGVCVDNDGAQCISIWVDIDISWLLGLFK